MIGIVPGKDYKTLLAGYTRRYQAALPGSNGEAYLSTRGITLEAIKYFRLGYVAEPEPEHRQYFGMIAIPYVTRGGIVTIRFRDTSQGQRPKYLSLPGPAGQARPYNVRALQTSSQRIFVCEGEIDTMTVTQCGLAGIGFPGAASWKQEYARLFRYRHVTVLADSDDSGAGGEFAEKVAADLRDVTIIKMPSGHDVNSFFTQEGREALRKHIGA